MSDELILVVEDSDEDVEAIERAVGRSHPDVRLEFVRRGDAVLPRLADPAVPLPDLLLLDLNMPGESGLTILIGVRAVPAYRAITVVVFTSSTDSAEADRCYAAGADSYVYKPINFALFQTVLRGTIDYWRSRTTSALYEGSGEAAGNVSQIVVPPPGVESAQA
ncbi:response regulator [Actinoplanes sp. CA-051413]|uniref:response regulator n=1 Tax=Actinoplanes sp. CA-051413 TaxID=3239899 RepID=UPI003D97B7B1